MDESKLQPSQSVNGIAATSVEAEGDANKKSKNAQLSRKKTASAPQAATSEMLRNGYGAGAVVSGLTAAPVYQWTLSPQGAAQRSLDGKSWQSVSLPDQVSFRALSAISGDIWVGGKSGSLYHSPDSGRQWTRVVPKANGANLTADITRVGFSDLQSGVIETSNGQVWTTSDGGQTWQRK